MSDEPNYKIIELQTENEHLKDKLIASLESEVQRLNSEVIYLKSLLHPEPLETDVGSHMMVSSDFKHHVRTVSEVGALLERRSMNIVRLPKSVEDLENET